MGPRHLRYAAGGQPVAFIEYTGDSEAMIVYQAPSGKKYRFNSGTYSKRAIRGTEAIAYFEKLVDFKVTRRVHA